jgi:hypothetical protein
LKPDAKDFRFGGTSYTIEYNDDHTLTLASVIGVERESRALVELADLQRRHDQITSALANSIDAMEAKVAENPTMDELGYLYMEQRKLTTELDNTEKEAVVRYESVTTVKEWVLDPLTFYRIDAASADAVTMVQWIPHALLQPIEADPKPSEERLKEETPVKYDAKDGKFRLVWNSVAGASTEGNLYACGGSSMWPLAALPINHMQGKSLYNR